MGNTKEILLTVMGSLMEFFPPSICVSLLLRLFLIIVVFFLDELLHKKSQNSSVEVLNRVPL